MLNEAIMTNKTDTIQRLMDAGENRIRSAGYHAMSFRDLADDMGIKSSSVHYYFRHKEDLAVALVERYSEKFFAQLQNQNNGKPSIAALCALYRAAFTAHGHICLCGMLGAEKNGLPKEVNQAVAQFLGKNVS